MVFTKKTKLSVSKPPKDKALQKKCYDKIMKPSLDAYIFQLQTKADALGPDQSYAKMTFRNFLDVRIKLLGRWIFSGVSQQAYILTNQEFQASMRRRDAFVNKDIPQYSEYTKSEDKSNYLCSCSDPSKPIDPYGYHLLLTSCKL